MPQNQKKPVTKTMVTPVGIASFPHLNEPDTAFKQCCYKVDLVLGPQHREIIDGLSSLLDKWVEENPGNRTEPWEWEVDKETGQETGNFILKFKQDAYVKIGDKEKHMKPELIDAQGMATDAIVGYGSKLRVAFQGRFYCFCGRSGIRLAPLKIKIEELVAPSSGDDPFDIADEQGVDFTDILGDEEIPF